MSTNCLVTKLKESIQNENLEKLGFLLIDVNASSNNTSSIAMKDSAPTVFNVLTEGLNYTSTDSLNRYPIFSGSGTIEIKDKYNIETLRADKNFLFNIERMKFLTSLINLDFHGSNSYEYFAPNTKLSDIPIYFPNLKRFAITNSRNVSGVVRDLLPLKNTLVTMEIEKLGINFNFNDLGLFPLLNNIQNSLTGNIVSGSVEEFVANKRNSGVTTGSLTITGWINGKPTFKGEDVHTRQESTISWTENTITFNGETIDA